MDPAYLYSMFSSGSKVSSTGKANWPMLICQGESGSVLKFSMVSRSLRKSNTSVLGNTNTAAKNTPPISDHLEISALAITSNGPASVAITRNANNALLELRNTESICRQATGPMPPSIGGCINERAIKGCAPQSKPLRRARPNAYEVPDLRRWTPRRIVYPAG
jgi:hypothetical protein